MTATEGQIRELLGTYERSLDTSDADLAASCYTPDGIFTPTTLPTVAGTNMAEGYGQIFEAIRLDVTFTIDELVVTGHDTAYGATELKPCSRPGTSPPSPTARSSSSTEPTPTAGRSPATC